jgi:hypothetical protein
MWLSNSKKYAMDGFLEERASGGSVHQVVGNGIQVDGRFQLGLPVHLLR